MSSKSGDGHTILRLRERANFVGERMMEDGIHIKYKSILMKFRPKMVRGVVVKQGAGRMILAAQVLGKQVARMVRGT